MNSAFLCNARKRGEIAIKIAKAHSERTSTAFHIPIFTKVALHCLVMRPLHKH